MYLSREGGNNDLVEIHNRVQAMALIHQNIYKSIEMNLVDIASYIRDLMNYLKSLHEETYISFTENVRFEHMSLNTLVPLGLFLTEVIQVWTDRMPTSSDQIEFNISLSDCNSEHTYRLTIKDKEKQSIFTDYDLEDDKLSNVLISALVEQMEGEVIFYHDKGNQVKLCFNPID